ncbi:hypothetical protein [Geotalea toluenoxydans]|uniref:hypothetical protein n=1 Tax=Geotalea toluenoxydans TaxID=421624 RepID=UPI0006D29FF2|nr:hypothetical protein [Geotalea toluenoxydans]
MRLKAEIIGVVAGTATSTFAAGEPREDGSGLAVIIFLAFCALIVVGQLLPIFRTRISQRRAQLAAKEAVTGDNGENR